MKEQTDITPAPAPEFNFFAGGIKVIEPTGSTTLKQVIDWVKNGKYADVVANIRTAKSEKEAKFLKKFLDYVTFSGTFVPVRHAENLRLHSGYIVLDFDHNPNAAHLKMQLETDPYVAACFLSPRGEGVKAVIRIKDPGRHKETFADLAYYFNDVYRLTDKEKVDPSGSDWSRACFLSHDPTAYYNPDSKVYAIKNLVPAKAPRTVQQMAQDATETEKHIAAVVERIEHHQMDICNEYGTEWLLIAFSLSTLGEAGRDYFHRVSRLNAKYDEKDTEEKFDNAIKTTRFTNPAKFFSICKDYGVDVSKPKKQAPAKAENAKKDPTQKSGTGQADGTAPFDKPAKKKKRDRDLEDYDENTVWYTFTGGMKIKGGKYWDDVASNFQLYIKYRTEDEQENVTWVLEIRKASGKSEFMEVIHDDFCSARKLKNLLATKRLGFKIKDGHLDELQSYLFTQTTFASAMKVVRYGFHPDSKVYFFANKALNLQTNELLTPDEFGIVEANEMHLSTPQQSKLRQLRYTLTSQDVSFAKFWKLYATAHLRENAFIPVCFYIFSLFRDMGLQYKNFSPILYLKGGAGTGKSSMVRILTAAFGRKQEGVNLKSKNTDAALVKLMSQTSNSIIWFDEFHNELTNEGLLQAAYDNDGYHKSTTDFNSIDTATVDIHSALALTSNYLPENQIFFSRCVFVPITAQQKTDIQRQAYDKLEEIQEQGLGQMTIELLKHRSSLEGNDNYAVSYNRIYNSLKTRFKGQNVPERLFANMSQILAAPYALQCMGHINILEIETQDEKEILAEFVEMGEMFIIRQYRIQNESKAVAEFFEIIQMLFDANQIHEGFHFRFNGDSILINFRKLYNLFSQKYRQLFYKTPPDRDTIQSELTTLAGKTEWEEISKNIRFNNPGDGNSKASTVPQSGSCELNYKQLSQSFGIDLLNRAIQPL